LEQEVVQLAPHQICENWPTFASILFDAEASLARRLAKTPKIRGQGGVGSHLHRDHETILPRQASSHAFQATPATLCPTLKTQDASIFMSHSRNQDHEKETLGDVGRNGGDCHLSWLAVFLALWDGKVIIPCRWLKGLKKRDCVLLI